jgi:hypothetical protein
MGRAEPGLFDSVVGTRQAKRALCVWVARLGFDPVAVLK